MIRRRFASVTAVTFVALGFLTSSCSTVSGDAASVDGRTISQSDFEDMLGGYAAGVNGALDSNGTVLGSVARGLLTDWIGTQVLHAALVDRGIEIGDDALASARAELETNAGFADVGSAAQDFYVLATAVRDEFLAANSVSDDEARSSYEEGAVTSGVYCLRGILADDRAGIDEIAAQLAFGADFAEVAVEFSTDTSTGPNGGILANGQTGAECLGAAEIEAGGDPALVEGIVDLGVGEITDPIELASGKFVIVTIRPFDEVADEIVDLLSRAPAEEARDRAFESAKVSVSSRYGRWDPTTGSVVELDA